jgi:hypothetical protein
VRKLNVRGNFAVWTFFSLEQECGTMLRSHWIAEVSSSCCGTSNLSEKQLQLMVTYYNHYILKHLKQQHMCVGCCYNNGVLLKKKAQTEMGQRFQCIVLPAPLLVLPQSCGTAALSLPTANCDDECNTSYDGFSDECSTASAPNGPVLDLMSPSRKSVRVPPKRIIRCHNNPHWHTGRVIKW